MNRILRCFSRALVCLLALSSLAFAAGPFTLEQVMSSPFPSDLTVQPRGGRIAWVFTAKGVRNVWIADAPDFRARQVTRYAGDDGQAIASVRLTPDGKTIVYARGSETNGDKEVANPNSSVEQPKQQVWAMEIDGTAPPRLLGEMACGEEGCEDIQLSPDGQTALWAARKQLWVAPVAGGTPAKPLAYVRGDNSDPRWSPEGKRVVFRSDRGDHSFIGVYDGQRDTILWLAPSVDRDMHPRWSLDGKQVAFIRVAGRQQRQALIPLVSQPWSIWIADASTGNARAIWRSGTDLRSSYPRLTAEASFQFANGRIVFASEQDGRNHLYSVATNGGPTTLLTPGDFDAEHVSLSIDDNSVLYSSNQDDVDRRHLWRVAVAGGRPQALTRGETNEWRPMETGDAKFVVCFGSSGTSPAMPYRVTSSGREMIAREALPADFPSAQLVEPKQVVFKAEDGWSIHGQLFVPRGRTAPGPALVFIHGGSMRQMLLGFHYMYYYHNAYEANQYLASLGYVVLSVNYRTGIMYGRDFREPSDGGWRGASEYKDVVAAGKYLQSLPIVDAKKVGLWGGSYGGFLTAMGLARNSDIFVAGVDLHGVHDWSTLRRIGGPTSDAPDALAAAKLAFESSPNSAIATWKSPVLLIQGDDDRNVAFSQTVDLAQRLRAQRVPFEQVVFPDEIHDFLLWRNWVRAYAAGAEFFDRILKRGEQVGEAMQTAQ
jgi:dipeptidyl aminopeptidase/acylaminoacyl peptidase